MNSATWPATVYPYSMQLPSATPVGHGGAGGPAVACEAVGAPLRQDQDSARHRPPASRFSHLTRSCPRGTCRATPQPAARPERPATRGCGLGVEPGGGGPRHGARANGMPDGRARSRRARSRGPRRQVSSHAQVLASARGPGGGPCPPAGHDQAPAPRPHLHAVQVPQSRLRDGLVQAHDVHDDRRRRVGAHQHAAQVRVHAGGQLRVGRGERAGIGSAAHKAAQQHPARGRAAGEQAAGINGAQRADALGLRVQLAKTWARTRVGGSWGECGGGGPRARAPSSRRQARGPGCRWVGCSLDPGPGQTIPRQALPVPRLPHPAGCLDRPGPQAGGRTWGRTAPPRRREGTRCRPGLAPGRALAAPAAPPRQRRAPSAPPRWPSPAARPARCQRPACTGTDGGAAVSTPRARHSLRARGAPHAPRPTQLYPPPSHGKKGGMEYKKPTHRNRPSVKSMLRAFHPSCRWSPSFRAMA